MKLIVVSCLVALACAGAAGDQTPVVLCGRQLAKARVLLCYGSEYLIKRSLPQSILSLETDEDNWDDEWPLSGRRAALSAPWGRHKREGLADECCLKPCTTDVILNYC